MVLVEDTTINLENYTLGTLTSPEASYEVISENTSEVNCTVSGTNLIIDLVATSYKNASCTLNATAIGSGMEVTDTFYIEINPISIAYCSGMTKFQVLPTNSTHKMVQPTNQSSTTCTYNVSNSASDSIILALKLNTTLGWLNSSIISSFDNLFLEKWQAPVATSTNSTWNWTKNCLYFSTTILNSSHGTKAGLLIYNFNDTDSVREYTWSNGTIESYYNVTFDCPSQQYINKSPNNYTYNATSWNWQNYDTVAIDWFWKSGDATTPFRIEVRTNNASQNSSWQVIGNTSAWQTLTLTLSGINRSQVTQTRIWLNETPANASGQFYLDNFRVYNATSATGGLSIGVNATGNSTITWLTTSYQNITTIPSNSWAGIWFWYNYTNPSKIRPYKFQYNDAVVI
jgi:hypothetical protein